VLASTIVALFLATASASEKIVRTPQLYERRQLEGHKSDAK